MSGDRDRLLTLFQAALTAVRGDCLAEAALVDSKARHVIALGKAAEALATGAWRVGRDTIRSGFVALPCGYGTGELSPEAPFVCYAGAHPVPDESSLMAGAELERYAAGLPRSEPVVVFVSGGASACVECPAPGVNLDLLRRTNAWLLGSGLPITAINAVRARLSRLKGGGLAHWLQGCEVSAWVLSDVMGDADQWVGGAPLSAVPADLPPLPDWLHPALKSMAIHPSATVPLQRLAGNRDAVAAVCAEGAHHGGDLTGSLEAACADIVGTITESEPGLFVWGGETTFELPDNPGRGGRCRHLALTLARELAGSPGWSLLAASTDGWDGTDAVAGACVNGTTLERGGCRGRDTEVDLAHADSGSFFAGSDEEIITGSTGTNVNDLIIALKH
ncbi:MAG: DUF4147 domain-containing protein [Gammaproteobacteria bacterium]